MRTSLVVLEYVKALAWPIAVAVALIAFRRDLHGLIPRMTKLEALGASAEFERAVADAGITRAANPSSARPPRTVIHATNFMDANAIRKAHREGPLVVDLAEARDEVAMRLVDFTAGLVAGTDGTIQRLTRNTFIVDPTASTTSVRGRPLERTEDRLRSLAVLVCPSHQRSALHRRGGRWECEIAGPVAAIVEGTRLG